MKKTLTFFTIIFLTITATFAIPSFDDSQRAKADGFDYGFNKGIWDTHHSSNIELETKAKQAAEERGYTDEILKTFFYDGAELGWKYGGWYASKISVSGTVPYYNPFREYIINKELPTTKQTSFKEKP